MSLAGQRLDRPDDHHDVFISTFLNGTMIHDCQTSVGTRPGAAGTYMDGPNTIAAFDDVRISTP